MGNKPKKPIFTNFDGTNVPDDFEFPSINLEDIDRAVFNLFDKIIDFQVEQGGVSKKVPVIFSTGERFALTRRKSPIRDKNNAIILPIISIMRGAIDVSSNQHGFKTAISYADQPQYYVKRRLHQKDRQFQNILNKQGIKNQDNVSARKNYLENTVSPGNIAKPGTVTSRRNGNNLSFLGSDISLADDLSKNIYEIIEIPYPIFTGIKYSAVFWGQYLTQVNEMMQALLSSFPGQAHEISFKTNEGYELVAFFDNSLENDVNFDNFSDEERIIKYTINFTVPGYILNSNIEKGTPKKIRSYISAPMINFGYIEPKTDVVFNNQPNTDSNLDKFTLSDIKNENEVSRELKRGESNEDLQIVIEDPLNKSKKIVFEKVLSKNKRAGETVVSARLVKTIDSQYE